MKVNIFQLFYDKKSRKMLDPGFIPLEIAGNPRPDWREYWAIRKYFLKNTLRENDYYGFLSPLFKEKTCLDSQQVFAFIAENPGDDVYTFSPSFPEAACYLNVFEHGNRCHPGMIPVMKEFLDMLEINIDFSKFINDFRSTVFCNYIIAKPVFWNRWFTITERLFQIAERKEGRLAQLLNKSTDYHKASLSMKVFIIERIASLLLALLPELKVCDFEIQVMPWKENANYFAYRKEMVLLNALKIAYADSFDTEYLRIYFSLRTCVLQRCEALEFNEHHIDFFHVDENVRPAKKDEKDPDLLMSPPRYEDPVMT
jgi:hypothetical protein